MSAQLKNAAANTALRIANMFEQNCAFKHGLPKVGGPDRIGDMTETEQAAIADENLRAQMARDLALAQLAAENSKKTNVEKVENPTPGATAAAPVGNGLLRAVAPYILAGVVGGAPVAAYQWFSGTSKPHPTQPVAAPPVVQPVMPGPPSKTGSLLQYLQDNGYHLENGKWMK